MQGMRKNDVDFSILLSQRSKVIKSKDTQMTLNFMT